MRPFARALVLIILLGAYPWYPAYADTTTDSLLAAVVQQGRADRWSSTTMPCVAVDFNGTRYICRVDNGQRVKTSKSTRSGVSVVGDWAAITVEPLDAKFHPASRGAQWLMHRTGRTWHLGAIDEGVGYSRGALRKALIPSDVIRRLKLQTAD